MAVFSFRRCVFQMAIAAFSSAIIMGQSSLGSVRQGQHKREWGNPVNGQAISIAVEKEKYITGDKIILDIAVKNVSDHDVKSLVSYPLALFRIRVLLPDGHKAPLTMWGRREVLDSPGGNWVTAPYDRGNKCRSGSCLAGFAISAWVEGIWSVRGPR